MPETPYVPIEELRRALDGLTLRQIRWDIRHGYMPGTIDHRNMPRMARHDLNDFLAGTWTPAADEETPVIPECDRRVFLRTIGKSA